MPCLSDILARLPKISSASQPACSNMQMPMAVSISFIRGTCSLNSVGMGFLVPLYAAYLS